MPRIRTIKPEFWADEKLVPLAPIDRLVFLALLSFADDSRRLVDTVKAIDGFIFPRIQRHISRESHEWSRRMNARGSYRSLYASFWDDHDVRHLSHLAYRVLTTLKGTLPAAGIGYVLDDLLAQRCACTQTELKRAYDELERPKRIGGIGWIVHERGFVWVVNALKYEPTIRSTDPKHRAHVAELLAPLGGIRSPLQVVQSFLAHYSDWFVDAASEGAKPSERARLRGNGSRRGASSRSPEGSEEGGTKGSRLAQYKTKQHRTTKNTTTWLTPYLNEWQKRYDTQVSAPGKLTSFLKRVEDQVGSDECRARWERYLASCPVDKASAARFAETHTAYGPVSVPVSTSSAATSTAARRLIATDCVVS